MECYAIGAVERSGGIGVRGGIPWKCRADMREFARLTRGRGDNAVIMGRVTWESLPGPLQERLNIVVTSSPSAGSAVCVRSLGDALSLCRLSGISEAWVIGGSRLYQEAIESGACSKVYLTTINDDWPCDTFFPLGLLSTWTPLRASSLEEADHEALLTVWSKR